MENITREDFDQIVSHTIRIELIDGNILHYMITPEAKKVFNAQLMHDSISVYDKEFLWFYIPEDRLVFINEKDVIRITFCFDVPATGDAEYADNFKVLEKFPREIEEDLFEEGKEMEGAGTALDLPQLIIMHRREKEDSEIVRGVTMKTEGFYSNVSYYFDLSKDQVSGLEFNYYEDEDEWVLLSSKYFQFLDEDGEENFMPHKNLSVIEINRSFIMNDETLNAYLGREEE
jgi:hypothetical protein